MRCNKNPSKILSTVLEAVQVMVGGDAGGAGGDGECGCEWR